jgi:hypothetical protein
MLLISRRANILPVYRTRYSQVSVSAARRSGVDAGAHIVAGNTILTCMQLIVIIMKSNDQTQANPLTDRFGT